MFCARVQLRTFVSDWCTDWGLIGVRGSIYLEEFVRVEAVIHRGAVLG